MTEDDRDKLRAWLDLLAASNQLKKSIDTSFRSEFGISISRFDVMAALDRAGKEGLRAGDLSQRLMVSEGNTTQVTSPLIRDGLVTRTPCEKDGRVAIFRLSAQGQNMFNEMADEHRAWIHDAFADFSPSQLASLRRLLAKVKMPPHKEEDRSAA